MNDPDKKFPWPAILGAIVILVGAKFALMHWVDSSLAEAASPADSHARQFALDVRLFAAVRAGNIEETKSALAAGASVNAYDPKGHTPLSIALKNGAWEIADLCLPSNFSPALPGAAVNGRPGCIGDAALYWACRQGRVDLAKRLLELGARPNGRNAGIPVYRGETIYEESPLAGAVEAGSIEIISLLTQRQAETNGRFTDGAPLLWIPVRTRNLPVLVHLLKNVKWNVYPEYNATTFDQAIRAEWVEGVMALLEANFWPSDLNEKVIAGIKDAKIHGVLLRAKTFAHFGLRSKSDKPVNPLRETVAKLAADFYTENLSVIALQIKNMPPEALRLADSRGWSLVFHAVDAGKLDVLRLLVARGANVNVVALGTDSPLCLAVKLGNLPIAQYLVASGASTDICFVGGSTPLGWAAVTRNREIFNWLLAHGAHAEPPDGLLKGPVIVTDQVPSEPHGRPLESPLMLAASVGDSSMAKRLLEAGANPKLASSLGYTVMLYALLGKNQEIVKTLVARGLDPKAELAKTAPALSTLIRRRDVITARLLLEAGVPIAASAIDEAAGSQEASDLLREFTEKNQDTGASEAYFWDALGRHSQEQVVAFLAEGGHVNFVGADTPLQLAIARLRFDLIPILLENGADPNLSGSRNSRPVLVNVVSSGADEDSCCTMIRLLVTHGAKIDAATRWTPGYESLSESWDGQTALLNSVVRGSSKITRTMLDLGASVLVEDRYGRNVDYYFEHGSNYTDATRRQVRSWLDETKKKQTTKGVSKATSFLFSNPISGLVALNPGAGACRRGKMASSRFGGFRTSGRKRFSILPHAAGARARRCGRHSGR